MAKVVVTTLHDWRKIAELAGGDPLLIMFDPSLSELEVPDVTQAALDAAFTTYTADQTNIDAATATAIIIARRNRVTRDVSDSGVSGIRIRALIMIMNRRDNALINRIIELQDTLKGIQAAGGTPANRLNGLPTSYMPTSTRTRAQIVQEYKDDIDSGDADS